MYLNSTLTTQNSGLSGLGFIVLLKAYQKKTNGWWIKGSEEPVLEEKSLYEAVIRVSQPLSVINFNGRLAVGRGGSIYINDTDPSEPCPSFNGKECYPLAAYIPGLHPETLGDPHFKNEYNLRYAYVAGAMANGITSVKMVEETGRSGMIGFFGAAGLGLNEIETAIEKIQNSLKHLPFGFNLIQSPHDPELEAAIVNLYIQRGIRLISASAYMNLTIPLVYYRVKGIYRDKNGDIKCPNKIFAKVSRTEVAERFLSPPQDKFLTRLFDMKMITEEEAFLAKSIPMADVLTAEADSGGHTDNRPAISLLPTILALRDKITEKFKYIQPVWVGLGGGIATPASTAAAFAMGAAFVLTGSVNQSCVEAGTSDTVRKMLAEAGQADVTMAPAADMFEMGVKVQVLKRGTMFPLRGAKLYELYSGYNSFADIPEKQRIMVEKNLLRCSFDEEWENTKNFFLKRGPNQIERAERDPKHQMALVFRSYLGRSSAWPISEDLSRKIDYQIWCGPSIGAFNEWAKGSFLEKPENRKTVTIAMNLLFGASAATRVNWLAGQGVLIPRSAKRFVPMELFQIEKLLSETNL